ncbi:MAG: GTP cyclohydrolase I FolE [Deltaproteobacteria bacterium]|nr:GTP cyclohydrolase I FolE [Deltaproteobacteria bacterium]
MSLPPFELVPRPLAPAVERTAAPSAAEAQEAVRTLLRFIGEDPAREGLAETPARLVRAWGEYFAGYQQEPAALLGRTFDEVDGYNDLVVLRDIRFESHCEHHLAPIIGRVHLAYLPSHRVVGISKLARVVDAFARRLQVQERMTAQIAQALQDGLDARAVGVVVVAEHHCMTTRGVHRPGVSMVTRAVRGPDAEAWRAELLAALQPGTQG